MPPKKRERDVVGSNISLPRKKKRITIKSSSDSSDSDKDAPKSTSTTAVPGRKTKVTNFYEIAAKADPDNKVKPIHYSNESKIQIKVPFQMTISGKTGSGKTNCLMEIIKQIRIFDKIYLCIKDDEEPLYKWFIELVRQVEKDQGVSILTVITDIAQLPETSDLDRELVNLLVVDDMINEKDKLLARVQKFYTMGRKANCSSAFLSQSYYTTPKVIRKNSGQHILKNIAQTSDLKRILADYSDLDIEYEQLLKLYKEAMETDDFNFFMIDTNTKDENLRFRINFEGIPASEWKAQNELGANESSSLTRTIVLPQIDPIKRQ